MSASGFCTIYDLGLRVQDLGFRLRVQVYGLGLGPSLKGYKAIL